MTYIHTYIYIYIYIYTYKYTHTRVKKDFRAGGPCGRRGRWAARTASLQPRYYYYHCYVIIIRSSSSSSRSSSSSSSGVHISRHTFQNCKRKQTVPPNLLKAQLERATKVPVVADAAVCVATAMPMPMPLAMVVRVSAVT